MLNHMKFRGQISNRFARTEAQKNVKCSFWGIDIHTIWALARAQTPSCYRIYPWYTFILFFGPPPFFLDPPFFWTPTFYLPVTAFIHATICFLPHVKIFIRSKVMATFANTCQAPIIEIVV